MEVNLMSNLFEFPRDQELADLLDAVGTPDGPIKVNLNLTRPIKTKRIYKILNQIMNNVADMNKGKSNLYGYGRLEKDLNYVRDCLLVFFKFYMSGVYTNAQVKFRNKNIDAIVFMVKWYKEFLDFTISMCRNNGIINGRPGVTDSINFFTAKTADFSELHSEVDTIN